MRFIYLSTTKEKGDFETIEKSVKYFEAFISDPEKDFNFKSKISRSNFSLHEDIFFLKTAKRNGKNTYIVVAYGRSSTAVPVSYTHLRAHETDSYLVCRL